MLYKGLRTVDPWPWRMNQQLPGYGRVREQEGTEEHSSLAVMSCNRVCVFPNKVLPSSCGELPREITIVGTVWEPEGLSDQ